jgi:UV DNA damage endonuclease
MPRRKAAVRNEIEPTAAPDRGLRLGLCCQFSREPIKFRTTTAAVVSRLKPSERRQKLSDICLHNAAALEKAVLYCAAHGIGSFRIISTLLPLKTHPTVGYAIDELPRADAIVSTLRHCGATAAAIGIRTTFHPDQFVVLNSPRADVVEKSIEDLEYHAEVAEWVGADVINIHGGGAYGDKTQSLQRLAQVVEQLSDRVRSRLTFENDDKVYTPTDLLAICGSLNVPLAYDVHHHRCLPDGLSVEEVTAAAIRTWNREPLFHISSPLAGWSGPRPERHHDEIDVGDFPPCWLSLRGTVDVEAKGKEIAVLKLREQLTSCSRESAVAAAVAERPSKKARTRSVRIASLRRCSL